MCIISVLGGISTVGNVFAADGNVIYVSDSGKDTAAGTSSTAPKKTLASAYSALFSYAQTAAAPTSMFPASSTGIS